MLLTVDNKRDEGVEEKPPPDGATTDGGDAVAA